MADLEDTGHVADKVWQVGGHQVFVCVVILVIQRVDTLFFYFSETDLNENFLWYKVDSAAARRKNERRQNGHTVCNGPYCEFYRSKNPPLIIIHKICS